MPLESERELCEGEIQVLIASIECLQPIETPNNMGYIFYPKTIEEAARYFRGVREDWTAAYPSLVQRGLMVKDANAFHLTKEGEVQAKALRLARPPLYYWYSEFYRIWAHTPVFGRYCERVYGANLCQDGFMDMDGLNHIIAVTGLHSGQHVLDLGCGNGMIAEYLSDQTGAVVEGMDYIPEAVAQANQRTEIKRDRLSFRTGNLDHLEYPPASFDLLLAVDTLYMPNDLADTVRQMKTLLKPGGKMAVFYSYALWQDPDASRDVLQADRTPAAMAFHQNGLRFQSWDYRDADSRLAKRMSEAAELFHEEFEAGGMHDLYISRIGESQDILQGVARGTHSRYLYLVQV